MSSNGRKTKGRWNNRVATIAVALVVLSLVVIVNLRISSLKATEATYAEKEAYIAAQLEKEQQRAETLEEYRVYVQTKQYIEKVAKEKLGLVNPDEILLKPAE